MIDAQLQSELRAAYNPDGSQLRNLQLRLLEILRVVDNLCNKHSIPYWIEGGTLLGAVRHEGFIPWDDDIDICMLREDYKRFVKIAQTELPCDYKIQYHKTDKNYFLPFSKVRDTYGDIKENGYADHPYKYNGAFIDVFPMEPVIMPLSKLCSYIVYIIKCISFRYPKSPISKILKTVLWKIEEGVAFFGRLLKSKGKVSSGYGCYYPYKFPLDVIFPLSTNRFENFSFRTPYNKERYLTIYFGNYMQLPLPDDRVMHLSLYENDHR